MSISLYFVPHLWSRYISGSIESESVTLGHVLLNVLMKGLLLELICFESFSILKGFGHGEFSIQTHEIGKWALMRRLHPHKKTCLWDILMNDIILELRD